MTMYFLQMKNQHGSGANPNAGGFRIGQAPGIFGPMASGPPPTGSFPKTGLPKAGMPRGPPTTRTRGSGGEANKERDGDGLDGGGDAEVPESNPTSPGFSMGGFGDKTTWGGEKGMDSGFMAQMQKFMEMLMNSKGSGNGGYNRNNILLGPKHFQRVDRFEGGISKFR